MLVFKFVTKMSLVGFWLGGFVFILRLCFFNAKIFLLPFVAGMRKGGMRVWNVGDYCICF